jgi:hypothetical protein
MNYDERGWETSFLIHYQTLRLIASISNRIHSGRKYGNRNLLDKNEITGHVLRRQFIIQILCPSSILL